MTMEVDMEKKEERRSNSMDCLDSDLRWERFLTRTVVRVLLVEADDSTRQIISAFLRKCNYKVAAVPDGLKAWEVLKGGLRNIDLILTEVELPSISGFALLTLIMEDDICKSIPVIMMSSHDSIGTVYKCMMKGASDFLMKPIRINELKNLWQHVWRRKSSTIACGLDPPAEGVAQQKDEAAAENNAASDWSTGSQALLQTEEACFKTGSDSQSSCMNLDLEAKSASAEEESQDLSGSKKMKSPAGNTEDMQDVNLCTNRVADENLCKGKIMMTQGPTVEESGLRMVSNCLSSQASEKTTMAAACSSEAVDLIGTFDNKGRYGDQESNDRSKIFESLELNLSLRRPRLGGSESNTSQKDALIRSTASAFSRYINKQIRPLPIERTMNSGEHSSIDAQANYSETKVGASSSYHRSGITLPMHNREGAQVPLLCKQRRPYPIRIAVKGANSSPHFIADRPISHEQHFICSDQCGQLEQEESVEEKTSFSPATDHSGSDSFCNGAVSHANRCANICTTNGTTSPSVPLTTATSEKGNVNERLNPLIQREAALTKFRLKRKERCYEKKVRYESRKKLADQRPRVKGQFVRRIPPNSAPPANPVVAYASAGG